MEHQGERNAAVGDDFAQCGADGFVHSVRRLRHRLRPAAYAEGSPTVALVRNMLIESTVENQKKYGFGDPEKGVQKMWELSKLENPPLRLVLGKDINKHAREYVAQLTKEMGEYESWSDHLGFED
uniref:Peroxisomal hydratase-dehydrogenase-epimerase n=1 Tax=Ganoderma boninense TaxID=34458 RepID=A0A5K1K1K8_9APHY|nr:Peroxisomal hydratase-dehydrogenase-epimerase [Ganoderma boninense]